MSFDGIPHLSYPVIRDHETACKVLIAVKAEMERRIELEHANPDEFEELPRLVLVIDEFPVLFTSESDKETVRSLVNTITDILNRGRHGKIHLVLAAQNPTFRSMKVELGNITGRIAFRCAKKNYSEVILGEGGAEKLSGQGTLLLKSPQSDGLQWIQGSYIKPEEIQEVVHKLTSRSGLRDTASKFILTIPADPPSEGNGASCSRSSLGTVAAGPSEQELLVAAVMFWAFGKEHISTNMLMNEYHLGWNRATGLVKKLEELGIVDKAEGKRPRYVRVRSIEDIPEKMVAFMERCDYPRESLICAFQERSSANIADGKYPVL